jgi:hypothetical protein
MTDVRSRIAEPLAGLSMRARAAFGFARGFACAFAPACALALAASLFGGCSGGCSRAPEPEPNAPVVDRMKDPEYIGQLKEHLAAQQEIAARGAAIMRELEAAREKDPESEETKNLEKKHAAISFELEKQRLLGEALIRERKNREDAERAKAKTSNGEK